MTKNQLISGIVSLVIVFAFLFGVYAVLNQSNNQLYPEANQVLNTDHVQWSTAKKNILVEYSDFECPACKTFHDYINKNIGNDKNITNKVTFIFRHYPLSQIHPNSTIAAYAAEASGRQGKFFPMADRLFAQQDSWTKSADVQQAMVELAKQLNLNINQFKKDLNSQEVKNKVAADVKSGDSTNLSATPTFFLNGKKLNDIQSFDQFKQLLINL